LEKEKARLEEILSKGNGNKNGVKKQLERVNEQIGQEQEVLSGLTARRSELQEEEEQLSTEAKTLQEQAAAFDKEFEAITAGDVDAIKNRVGEDTGGQEPVDFSSLSE